MLYLCQSRLCPTCGRVHNLKLIIIMTINRGYLKVPRALFYAEEWQSKRRFSRFEAVVSLLEQASYVDGRQMQLTGETVRLRRGQFVTTVRSLAEQWGWKKDSTARFLNNMVHRGLIRVETVTVKGATDNEADDAPCCATIRATTATCITVCNNDADEGDGDGCATACGTQSATTNATACETNIYNEENKELQECGKAGVKECVKGEKGLAHTHPTNNSEGVIGGEIFACNDADEQKDAAKNGRRVFTSEEWAKFSPAKTTCRMDCILLPRPCVDAVAIDADTGGVDTARLYAERHQISFGPHAEQGGFPPQYPLLFYLYRLCTMRP